MLRSLVLVLAPLVPTLLMSSRSVAQEPCCGERIAAGASPNLDHPVTSSRDEVEPGDESNKRLHLLPFAYAVDPSIARKGAWTFSYRVQGASGVDALRPLPANLSRRGLVEGGRVSFSVTDWGSAFAWLYSHHPLVAGAQNRLAVVVGTKLRLTPRQGNFQFGVELAAMREFGGDFGGYARLSTSYDLGRVRFVGNLHTEKVFASGRDAVDLLAFGGASVRVLSPLRLGVEYIGQDLEDAFEQDEAEGGAKHYVAPVASLSLRSNSLWLTGGPAFGVTARSPAIMGRVQLLAAF